MIKILALWINDRKLRIEGGRSIKERGLGTERWWSGREKKKQDLR